MAGLAASPPLQNPAANAVVGITRREIAPGALTPAHAVAEFTRKRKIEEMWIYRDGMVTDEEVVEAQARHVQALADLNPGVVPATLDQLQALLTPIRTSLVNLNDNVESLKHKVDAINENSKTFQRNSQSMRMSGGNNELWRPTKTSAGFAAAPPLPEMAPPGGPPAAVQQVFDAPAPPPGLRTLPPAALSFPATAGQTISRAELGYLARWYNDEFGIVAADNHDEQMKKFRDFLCGM